MTLSRALIAGGLMMAVGVIATAPAHAAPAHAVDDDAVARYCAKRYQHRADPPPSLMNRLFRSPPGMATGAPAPQVMTESAAPPPAPTPKRTAAPVADAVAPSPLPRPSRERYPETEVRGVQRVTDAPVSTFAADVDTASYTVVRRHLTDGQTPPPDAVRPEELINAFDYGYTPARTRQEGFRPGVWVVPAPWNQDRVVMVVGLKAYTVPENQRPPANLVFLMDVSGSMRAADKLPLAKQAICLLAHKLGPRDRVSLVTYAGASGVALPPTPGNQTETILAAMDDLRAGGSTAGQEGIELAYALAEKNATPGSVNRILLVTDGDFNVGINDPRALAGYVSKRRAAGIGLSVLGFGRGNYHDTMMQALAQNGDGVAAYVDTLGAAQKVLTRSVAQALVTVARDVKIQVEFNPARVLEYRLIGYETRDLEEADFANDAKDAGDVGSGHTVTALYEMALAGEHTPLLGARRYGGNQTAPAPSASSRELAFVKIRFQPPQGGPSRLIQRPVTDADRVASLAQAPADVRFATAVAWFAMTLRGDPIAGGRPWPAIARLARGAVGADPWGDRAGFVELVQKARAVVR